MKSKNFITDGITGFIDLTLFRNPITLLNP